MGAFAIVITESLARVMAAIRISGDHWWSSLLQNTEVSPQRPCVCCAVIRIALLAFIVQHLFHVELRNGLRELTAFVEY